MVNKQRMRLAVAALRSDEFEQGDGFLKKILVLPDGTLKVKHCCLGVFCEVAIREGLDLKQQTFPVGLDESKVKFNGHGVDLPLSVQEFYGLESQDPVIHVDEDGAQPTAVWANDCGKWDFGQIADAFETYYGLREDDGPLVQEG